MATRGESKILAKEDVKRIDHAIDRRSSRTPTRIDFRQMKGHGFKIVRECSASGGSMKRFLGQSGSFSKIMTVDTLEGMCPRDRGCWKGHHFIRGEHLWENADRGYNRQQWKKGGFGCAYEGVETFIPR